MNAATLRLAVIPRTGILTDALLIKLYLAGALLPGAWRLLGRLRG